MVSDQQRKDNQRAIRRRAQWRERYEFLSRWIRQSKQRLQEAHRHNRFDRETEVQLDGLRTAANIMMISREIISIDLQDTAYQYAERPGMVD